MITIIVTYRTHHVICLFQCLTIPNSNTISCSSHIRTARKTITYILSWQVEASVTGYFLLFGPQFWMMWILVGFYSREASIATLVISSEASI